MLVASPQRANICSSAPAWGIRRRYRNDEDNIKRPDQVAINERIKAPSGKVRLIGDDGAQAGVISLKEAIATARKAGLDLVAVAATADPVVCKIMDYNKEQYLRRRKASEAKKAQKTKVLPTKEIKLRAGIGDHDLDTKLRQGRNFLLKGHPLNVTLMRPKQALMDRGHELIECVVEELKDCAELMEQPKPRQGGLYMLAQLKPLASNAPKSD
eukprot:g2345.t1